MPDSTHPAMPSMRKDPGEQVTISTISTRTKIAIPGKQHVSKPQRTLLENDHGELACRAGLFQVVLAVHGHPLQPILRACRPRSREYAVSMCARSAAPRGPTTARLCDARAQEARAKRGAFARRSRAYTDHGDGARVSKVPHDRHEERQHRHAGPATRNERHFRNFERRQTERLFPGPGAKEACDEGGMFSQCRAKPVAKTLFITARRARQVRASKGPRARAQRSAPQLRPPGAPFLTRGARGVQFAPAAWQIPRMRRRKSPSRPTTSTTSRCRRALPHARRSST